MSSGLDKTDIMDNFIRLVNGVGFPIVVSMALFYFNIESLQNQTEMLAKFQTSMTTNVELLDKLNKETSNRNGMAERVIAQVEDIRLSMNEIEKRCNQ